MFENTKDARGRTERKESERRDDAEFGGIDIRGSKRCRRRRREERRMRMEMEMAR